jgi:hypothetical protein
MVKQTLSSLFSQRVINSFPGGGREKLEKKLKKIRARSELKITFIFKLIRAELMFS